MRKYFFYLRLWQICEGSRGDRHLSYGIRYPQAPVPMTIRTNAPSTDGLVPRGPSHHASHPCHKESIRDCAGN